MSDAVQDALFQRDPFLLEGPPSDGKFLGFGDDRLMPHPLSELQSVDHAKMDGLRDEVRRWAPRVPGVYGMIDVLGRLIYVGKSKMLRNRLLSYFMPTQEYEKGGRIAQSAARIVWEQQPSEFASLLREQHLIQTFRPRFNVQGVPQRQRSVFLCLGRKPAETFYLSREADPKAIAWAGPLMGATKVTRTAEVLNRIFGLRDCSNRTPFSFTDQLQLFDDDFRAGCLRYEIGNCLGPCVRGCSRTAYSKNVDRAAAFLQAESLEMIDSVERSMSLAASRMHFEQAAALRNDLQVLQWLTNRLRDHKETRQTLTCVYRVAGCDQRSIWYLIRRGVAEYAVQAPKTSRIPKRIHREIIEWHSSDGVLDHRFSRCESQLAIIARWFRSNPIEKRNLFAVEQLSNSTNDWKVAV